MMSQFWRVNGSTMEACWCGPRFRGDDTDESPVRSCMKRGARVEEHGMQTSLGIALICAGALAGASSARAESAERIANIRKAASEIAAVVSTKGAKETLAGIVDCYRRELAVAKSLTPN